MNPKLTDAQLLELIRHFSYDCCVVHDEAGIITFVSDSYQRITGHDPAQIIGEPISVLRERAIVEPSAGVQVLESKVPTTASSFSSRSNTGIQVTMTSFPFL